MSDEEFKTSIIKWLGKIDGRIDVALEKFEALDERMDSMEKWKDRVSWAFATGCVGAIVYFLKSGGTI